MSDGADQGSAENQLGQGAAMSNPLAGIRVLDFMTLLPGPLATLLLAEAGAEVIKIEHPDGENMRRLNPYWGKESVMFAMLNRGKKSVAADLKDPRVRDRILALAKTADVVVEQFRPGVMDRLGLGYGALSAINPKIIYCAITGYGQSGPRSTRAGHDLNYIGDAGLLALSSGPAGHRTVPPALIADIAGGSYPAVMNILLALRRRDAKGEGTFIDVSMTESVFPFVYWAIGAGLGAGAWPKDGGDRITGGSPRYHLYETRDGKVAAIAALDDPQFKARGRFAAKLVNEKGETLPAIPVPIDKPLRPGAATDASAPALGAHNTEFGF